MSFCPNCGNSVPDNSQFCPTCGANMQNNGQQQNFNQQPNDFNNFNNKRISFGQKNLVLAIVLSFVTCGIYAIIWLINIVDNLNEASDNKNGQSGGMVFLFSILTCGIYELYWYYKAGELLNNAMGRRNLPTDESRCWVYLLLGIFGLGIVTVALIQDGLNKIAEYEGAPKA